MDRRQIEDMSLYRRCTSWTRTVQKGLKPMLQPGSGLSGGVTQCLLLKPGSHAVASGIGSAMSVAHTHVSNGPQIGCRTVSMQCASIT